MSAICIDNSTECLLRILIETTANQTSPWEPRSFGFTVAIGVAAFLISFVAIFQGLLAAGPGRIKASSNAIGAFSTLTKGKLSWIEFAWRSTAYVPFINSDDVLKGLRQQSNRVIHGTSYPMRVGGADTGATWLQLFRSIGLDEEVDVIFDRVLRPCATDHLPADIQAPPLTISLQCLALLSAIADPTVTLEPADRFITIRGRVSQISFREHPVLGTIGGYERYQTRMPTGQDSKSLKQRLAKLMSDSSRNIRKTLQHYEKSDEEEPKTKSPVPEIERWATLGRCTSLALELSRGYLRLEDPVYRTEMTKDIAFTMHSPWFKGTPCSVYEWDVQHTSRPLHCGLRYEPFARAIALMVAQTDYEVRAFPWKRLKFDEVVKFLDSGLQWLFVDAATFSKYMARMTWNTDKLGYDDRNQDHDIVFEWHGSWITEAHKHKDLDISGDFNETLLNETFSHCYRFLGRMRNGEMKQIEDPTHLWEGHESMVWRSLKHIDILLRRDRKRAIVALNTLTKKILNDAKVSSTSLPSETNTGSPDLRNGSQTNSPLLRPSSSTSENSKTGPASSITATSTGSDVDVNPQESNAAINVQEPPGTAAESVTAGETTQQGPVQVNAAEAGGPVTQLPQASEEVVEVLPEIDSEELYFWGLLGIRALLFATLLRQGPDTSMLFESEFKDSIVKII